MSDADAAVMRRYEAARDDVVAALLELERNLPGDAREDIQAARERLQKDRFVLAVVGEFSSGKSFLLNALLGKFRFEGAAEQIAGLLATDINPSTATITELEYGASEEAYAYHEGGGVERVPLDRLGNFVAGEGEAPQRVTVAVDSPFLQRGFVLADTPGLASANPAHRRATLKFLPSADAVLYLIDTQQPFTEGDGAFLGIIRKHIDSIFIVQTKIDLWNQTESGKPAWENAFDRISHLAAVHSPGAYVYALSARAYAEGTLRNDPALAASSRFDRFLRALDASLIQTTGRARLQRANALCAETVRDACALIDRDLAMLARSQDELAGLRAKAVPELDRMDQFAIERVAECAARLTFRRERIRLQAQDLAEDLESSLTQAFDTTDIARLRDRARLHMLVDRTLAQVVGEFADEVAAETVGEIQTEIAAIGDRLPLRFSLADATAAAFDADPAANIWSGDLRAAVSATIVLDAIGGPAISLAQHIASRFASAPAGTYMKRELTADLRGDIFPALRIEIERFAQRAANQVGALHERFSRALESAALTERARRLRSIDRALAARKSGSQTEASTKAESQRSAITSGAEQIRSSVETFVSNAAEIGPADAGPEEIRRAHADLTFDRAAYDRGLRPQRWRIAVIGALRRGKSSLINAFAGHRVLADEAAGTIAFPVHVRYGEHEQAFALQGDGEWKEVEIEAVLDEATRNPVLILTPWSLPRELVLVHAPAFDTGDPLAEDLCMVSARAASEVLCLFSRQLSDRELALYERVAELGKPMLFAHTIADNESPSERRGVVELAQRYLRERNIAAQRIFTISTLEYAQAKRAGRAPAGWNELDALIATFQAHAESHMARLARLERLAAQEPEKDQRQDHPRTQKGFLSRLFGKGH
ncbi:MAG: dynamin family protein [Candidatus Eremiobacteraeota bacterium]|nr:dynamin family protein [Candidatus Eremiobacteraeota bacterium]